MTNTIDAEIKAEIAAKEAELAKYDPKYAGIVNRQENLFRPREERRLTGAERAWLYRERKAGRLPPKEPANLRKQRRLRRAFGSVAWNAQMAALSPHDRAFVRQMRRLHRTWPAFDRAWDGTHNDVKRAYMQRLGNIDDIRRILHDMEEIERLP